MAQPDRSGPETFMNDSAVRQAETTETLRLRSHMQQEPADPFLFRPVDPQFYFQTNFSFSQEKMDPAQAPSGSMTAPAGDVRVNFLNTMDVSRLCEICA